MHDAQRFLARVANDENLMTRMVAANDAEIQRMAENMGLAFTPNELTGALQANLDPEPAAEELEEQPGGVDVGARLVKLARMLER